MRFISVSQFKGKPYINIREYYEDHGVQKPGKKGSKRFFSRKIWTFPFFFQESVWPLINGTNWSRWSLKLTKIWKNPNEWTVENNFSFFFVENKNRTDWKKKKLFVFVLKALIDKTKWFDLNSDERIDLFESRTKFPFEIDSKLQSESKRNKVSQEKVFVFFFTLKSV